MATIALNLEQYECGPLQFRDADAYDRHVVFDHAVRLENASQRDRFEAVALALRDVLTHRWRFRQEVRNGYQVEQPDNWLLRPDPWEVAHPDEAVRVPLGCSFRQEGGAIQVVPGKKSWLLGIPYDRPVVGHGGKTINTLRLWGAAAPDSFDFHTFSSGDVIGAVAETLTAESLTRVLYAGDSTSLRQGMRFVQADFLVACERA